MKMKKILLNVAFILTAALLGGCDDFFNPDTDVTLDNEDYISEEYVPFARTSFGNLLLIRLDESEFNGNIYFSNHDLFNSKKNKFTISKVCNSFNEFIDSLYSIGD